MIKRIVKDIFQSAGFSIARTGNNKAAVKEFKTFAAIPHETDLPEFVQDSQPMLRQLIESEAKLEVKGDRLLVVIQGLKFDIGTWEEVFIIHEVFSQTVYQLKMPVPYVLIDVGFNVGITSLYLARDPMCEKIFAFEPSKTTREFAKKNISLNSVASKIELHPFGLGYPERQLSLPYSSSRKGNFGLSSKLYPSDEKATHNEELEIHDAADVFREIISSVHRKVIVKLDCEGAEYEIVNRLSETGLINSIEGFMIEWHGLQYGELLTVLNKAGFLATLRPDAGETSGMIYAFKTN